MSCLVAMNRSPLPALGIPKRLKSTCLSAVLDNIPLTALAIKLGGCDWGFLAYAVGVGGSMIWFGSAADQGGEG